MTEELEKSRKTKPGLFVVACLFYETLPGICSNRFIKAISPVRPWCTVILEQLRGVVRHSAAPPCSRQLASIVSGLVSS